MPHRGLSHAEQDREAAEDRSVGVGCCDAYDAQRDHIPKNVAVLTPETINDLHEILG